MNLAMQTGESIEKNIYLCGQNSLLNIFLRLLFFFFEII